MAESPSRKVVYTTLSISRETSHLIDRFKRKDESKAGAVRRAVETAAACEAAFGDPPYGVAES